MHLLRYAERLARLVLIGMLLATALPATAAPDDDDDERAEYVAARLFARADYQISGTVLAPNDAPIARAVIYVFSADKSDTLAGPIFTDAQGQYQSIVQTAVDVEGEAEVPSAYWVGQVYPNPVRAGRGAVVVPYTVPGNRREAARVEVYDATGRRVDRSVTLAAGVYFYRIRFADDSTLPARQFVLAEGGVVKVQAQQVFGAEGRGPIAAQPSGGLSGARGKFSGLVDALDVVVQITRRGFMPEERSVMLELNQANPVDAQLAQASAPTAAFSVGGRQQVGSAPTLFDGRPSSFPEGEGVYAWDFGDGTRGQGAQVAHQYVEPGSYRVRLTLASRFGATDTTSLVVEIAAAPTPIATNGRVKGILRAVDGAPLQGVRVALSGGTRETTTAADGSFTLTGLPVAQEFALRLAKVGFATQQVRVTVPVAESGTPEAELLATLSARMPVATLTQVENGARETGMDGTKVMLPPDALMRQDGTVATGDVTLALTPVDVDDPENVGAFPGRFEGIGGGGRQAPLLSFGAAEYAFEQNGEELNLAPGQTAEIEIPIYTGGVNVGDTVPLWSVDESTGVWTEEGIGLVVAADTPTGLALRATVGHFSWWNCDDFPEDEADLEDEDPDDGPCYTLDCSTSICQRVAVGCWVSGARRGQAKNHQRADEPYFEVRTFLGAEKPYSLTVPAERQTLLEASAIAPNGELIVGQLIVAPDSGASVPIAIELRPVGGTDGGTLPEGSTIVTVTRGESTTLTFEATAGDFVGLYAERADGSSVDALFSVEGPGEVRFPAVETPGGFAVPITVTGTYTLRVFGANSTEQGEVIVTRTDVIPNAPIAVGDTAKLIVDDTNRFVAAAFDATEGEIVDLVAGYPDEGVGLFEATVRLYAVDGASVVEVLERDMRSFGSAGLPISFRAGATGRYFAVFTPAGRRTGGLDIVYKRAYAPVALEPLLDARNEYRTQMDADTTSRAFTVTVDPSELAYLIVNNGFGDAFLYDEADGTLLNASRITASGSNRLSLVQSDLGAGSYTLVVTPTNLNAAHSLDIEYAAFPRIDLTEPFVVDQEVAPRETVEYAFRIEEGGEYNVVMTGPVQEGNGDIGLRTLTGSSITIAQRIDFPARKWQTGIRTLAPGAYRVGLTGGFSNPVLAGDATFRLVPIAAPLELPVADAFGETSIDGTFAALGDIPRVAFDGDAGDAIEVVVRAEDGLDSFAMQAILRRASKTSQAGTVSLSQGDARVTQEASGDTLLAFSLRLPETDRYTLEVYDDSAGVVGDFEVLARRVQRASAITVDDDLACAGATTRSLQAAIYALEDGGTVSLCAGTYTPPIELHLADVSLVGAGSDVTTIRSSLVDHFGAGPSFGGYSVITLEKAPRVQGVALEGVAGEDDQLYGLYASTRHDSLTIQDVAFRGIGAGFTQYAGYLQGTADRIVLDDVTVENARFGFSSNGSRGGTSLTLRDAVLDTRSVALQTFWADSVTVENVAITMSEPASEAADINARVLSFTGNTITTPGGGPEIQFTAYTDAEGDRPDRVIADNTIVAGGGTALVVSYFQFQQIPQAPVRIERNRIRADGTRSFYSALQVSGSSAATVNMPLTVRNNLFEGGAYGLRLSRLNGDAEVYVVNNTFGMDVSNVNASSVRAVQFSGNAAPATRLVFANNAIVAPSGSSLEAIDVPTTFAGADRVISRSNLFAGFTALYDTNVTPGAGDASVGSLGTSGAVRTPNAGSPLVDAGVAASAEVPVPATDLVGTARPQGAGVDVGAVEREQ